MQTGLGGGAVVIRIADMSSAPDKETYPATATPPSSARTLGWRQRLPWLTLVLLVLCGLACLQLWIKLSTIQEQLARQSADATQLSVQANSLAKRAEEITQETAAKVTLLDLRLSEVALQRTQLEELIQSLSRSRDENLVVDIESAIRLAQQQAQLTGSVEPLLAALRSADQRVLRAAQPRLTALQRAIVHDIERIKAAAVSDTPSLLVKLDELVRLADELVLANAVLPAAAILSAKRALPEARPSWWQQALQLVWDEARALVRLSRIEEPEAALLSPEQSFFLRENFKLRLLNARLGLLARQMDSARADLIAARYALDKYFDPTSRKTQSAAALLLQVQQQLQLLQLPRVDDTLAALATAAAGR